MFQDEEMVSARLGDLQTGAHGQALVSCGAEGLRAHVVGQDWGHDSHGSSGSLRAELGGHCPAQPGLLGPSPTGRGWCSFQTT